jgi:hypothetical protein
VVSDEFRRKNRWNTLPFCNAALALRSKESAEAKLSVSASVSHAANHPIFVDYQADQR